MTVGAWSSDPVNDPPVGACCTGGDCLMCEVKAVGARTLGLVTGGFRYDELDPTTRRHLREACGAVMADMSEALIERGLVAVKEPQ